MCVADENRRNISGFSLQVLTKLIDKRREETKKVYPGLNCFEVCVALLLVFCFSERCRLLMVRTFYSSMCASFLHITNFRPYGYCSSTFKGYFRERLNIYMFKFRYFNS